MKGALRRAVIGDEQACVSRHDANQRHIRKVEALGNHLRTDQDVDVALAKRGEHAFVRPPLGHRVGVHSRRDRLGKQLLDDGLQTLSTDAEFVHARALACRADLWPSQLVAAPMTDEAGATAVPSHRDRAVLTLDALATTRTQQHRRVAAAVQEQQHLVARAKTIFHQHLERARQHDAILALLLWLAAKVLHDDLRQRSGASANRQRQQLVDAAAGFADRLQRWGRRPEHDNGALDLAARDRHLASVVAGGAVLLE